MKFLSAAAAAALLVLAVLGGAHAAKEGQAQGGQEKSG